MFQEIRWQCMNHNFPFLVHVYYWFTVYHLMIHCTFWDIWCLMCLLDWWCIYHKMALHSHITWCELRNKRVKNHIRFSVICFLDVKLHTCYSVSSLFPCYIAISMVPCYSVSSLFPCYIVISMVPCYSVSYIFRSSTEINKYPLCNFFIYFI